MPERMILLVLMVEAFLNVRQRYNAQGQQAQAIDCAAEDYGGYQLRYGR